MINGKLEAAAILVLLMIAFMVGEVIHHKLNS